MSRVWDATCHWGPAGPLPPNWLNGSSHTWSSSGRGIPGLPFAQLETKRWVKYSFFIREEKKKWVLELQICKQNAAANMNRTTSFKSKYRLGSNSRTSRVLLCESHAESLGLAVCHAPERGRPKWVACWSCGSHLFSKCSFRLDEYWSSEAHCLQKLSSKCLAATLLAKWVIAISTSGRQRGPAV